MIELDYSASQKHIAIGYNYILFILQQIKQENRFIVQTAVMDLVCTWALGQLFLIQ